MPVSATLGHYVKHGTSRQPTPRPSRPSGAYSCSIFLSRVPHCCPGKASCLLPRSLGLQERRRPAPRRVTSSLFVSPKLSSLIIFHMCLSLTVLSKLFFHFCLLVLLCFTFCFEIIVDSQGVGGWDTRGGPFPSGSVLYNYRAQAEKQAAGPRAIHTVHSDFISFARPCLGA